MAGGKADRDIRATCMAHFASKWGKARGLAAIIEVMAMAPEVMNALAAAAVEARYFEIDSELGHSASGPEHAKWSPVLREFLEPLMARLG